MGRPGCSGKSFKVQKGLERVQRIPLSPCLLRQSFTEPGIGQCGYTDQQAPGTHLSPRLSARVTAPATAPTHTHICPPLYNIGAGI